MAKKARHAKAAKTKRDDRRNSYINGHIRKAEESGDFRHFAKGIKTWPQLRQAIGYAGMGAAQTSAEKAPETHILKGIIYPVLGGLQNLLGVQCVGKFALSGSNFASIYHPSNGGGNAAEDDEIDDDDGGG